DDFAGRAIGGAQVEVVVVDNLRLQLLEIIDLLREVLGNFRLQQAEIIAEIERHARKANPRANLRRQGKVVPRDSQLPQQPSQRPFLRAFGSVVCDGVQADVVITSTEAVE